VLWGAVGSSDWRSIAAKGAILMGAILGGIYSWLEEPGFILMVGTVISLAIIDRARFDFLRDRLALDSSEQVHRPLVLVDRKES
jgi:hypothetical protein